MAGIAELKSYIKEHGESKFNDLLDSYLIVTEKVTGSNFYIQKDGSEVSYYRRDDGRKISIIDRTISKFYEKAISFFESLDLDFPERLRFGFEYFPNSSPGFVKYDKLPENGLILNRILEKDLYGKTQKVIEDHQQIKEWSQFFSVSQNPILFEGYLTDESKERLKAMVENDFSFSNIMESIGSEVKKPFLSEERIDSLVFKFIDPMSEKITRLKMSDLKEEKDSSEKRRGTVDAVSIFLLDLIQFIEEKDLDSWEISGMTEDEKYLNLVGSIFKDYVKARKNSIEGMDFNTKEFAKNPDFQLNAKFIKDPQVLGILGNETNDKIFQIMLSSLRKKRDPELPNDVLTPMVIRDFNKIVNKIKDATSNEGEGLLSFGEYLHKKMLKKK